MTSESIVRVPRHPLKTEAIVLRSIRYGEADRILHLYTPHRGRVERDREGRAARRKSRFGGRLEPFFRLRARAPRGPRRAVTVTQRGHRRRPPAAARATPARSTAPRAPARRCARCSTTASRTPASTTCSANELALLDAEPARGRPRQRARVPRSSSCSPRASRPSSRPARAAASASTSSASPARPAAWSAAPARPARSALDEEAHAFLVAALGRPLADAPTRTRARCARPSARSARRSSTTRTCGCGRSARG